MRTCVHSRLSCVVTAAAHAQSRKLIQLTGPLKWDLLQGLPRCAAEGCEAQVAAFSSAGGPRTR